MRSIIMKTVFVAATALWAGQASATIIGGGVTGGSSFAAGGQFNLIEPIPFGFTVGDDNQQSDDLFGFNEDQNILLADALDLDVGTPQLAAGTEVASHYIFYDPVLASIEGFVECDAVVLGILTETDTLFASDVLANTDVTYLNPAARGLEDNTDSVVIDPGNPNRILIDFFAGSPGDYIRVLTERSPIAAQEVAAPGTLGLLGFSLSLLFLYGLRRKT